MSARGTKPRCSWCRSLEHTDRHDAQGRPLCPERRAVEAERERDRLRRPCHTCPEGIGSVQMFLGRTRHGESVWVCGSCAVMFEQLATALGGAPRRTPLLRVVG